MSANFDQLLKDLKEGSVYANILVSILGCALILYSVFLYFPIFFGNFPYMSKAFPYWDILSYIQVSVFHSPV